MRTGWATRLCRRMLTRKLAARQSSRAGRGWCPLGDLLATCPTLSERRVPMSAEPPHRDNFPEGRGAGEPPGRDAPGWANRLFSDPEWFAVLRDRVFPVLTRGRPAGTPLRVWV